jgi:hypothetical protein
MRMARFMARRLFMNDFDIGGNGFTEAGVVVGAGE